MELLNALMDQGLLHRLSMNQQGQLIGMSRRLSQLLGYANTTVWQDVFAEHILTAASFTKIQTIFNQPQPNSVVAGLELTFMTSAHEHYHVLAHGSIDWQATPSATLDFVLTPLHSLGQNLKQLEDANQVMSEMLQSTRVAYWCIEWEQPIRLNTSVDEIVQQVFETPSHWRSQAKFIE